MNPRRQKRMWTVLSIGGLLAAAITLMVVSLSENIDLFVTPSDIVAPENERKVAIGQRLRVGGMVVPGTVKYDDTDLKVSFDLVDTGPSITVKYAGLLPDLFREGQGIVATGKLVDETTIVADEVLAKHDEEYMPPELAEKMKGIKHVKPKQIQKPGEY